MPSAGSLRVPPEGRDESRFYTSASKGVQGGVAPLPKVWGCPRSLLLPPKSGGSRGLKEGFETAYEGHLSLLAKEGYAEGNPVQVGQR